MKKQFLLVLCLVLCVGLLCSCASQPEQDGERYQVLNQATQQAVTVTAEPTTAPVQEAAPAATEVNWDDGSYDPSAEEGGDTEPVSEPAQNPASASSVPTVNSQYAGASPVVIDPIDKPTATPVPALNISEFATYDALELGLSFQAPAGWTTDSSVTGSFTITNPDASVSFQAYLTISTTSVSSKYSATQMTQAVKNFISALKNSSAYSSVKSTNTADRTLLDSKGVYADYHATTKEGVSVYGRVHVTCINTKVYTVHMECPAEYEETYKKSLYNKMRSTLKVTK